MPDSSKRPLTDSDVRYAEYTAQLLVDGDDNTFMQISNCESIAHLGLMVSGIVGGDKVERVFLLDISPISEDEDSVKQFTEVQDVVDAYNETFGGIDAS